MRLLYIILLLSVSSFGASCYTAKNGFKAISQVSKEFSKSTEKSLEKMKPLEKEIELRNKKLATIADLEKKIRLTQSLNYKKSNAILHLIKSKKELLDIEISTKATRKI